MKKFQYRIIHRVDANGCVTYQVMYRGWFGFWFYLTYMVDFEGSVARYEWTDHKEAQRAIQRHAHNRRENMKTNLRQEEFEA